MLIFCDSFAHPAYYSLNQRPTTQFAPAFNSKKWESMSRQTLRSLSLESASRLTLSRSIAPIMVKSLIAFALLFCSFGGLTCLTARDAWAIASETITHDQIVEQNPLLIMKTKTAKKVLGIATMPEVQVASSNQANMVKTRLKTTAPDRNVARWHLAQYSTQIIDSLLEGDTKTGYSIQFPSCDREGKTASVTLKYPVIGQYGDRTVGALVTYTVTHQENVETPMYSGWGGNMDYTHTTIQVSDSLYAGMDVCNAKSIQTEVRFFYDDDKSDVILGENSMFTVGSLNFYDTNRYESVTVNDSDTIKIQTPNPTDPTTLGNTKVKSSGGTSTAYGFRYDGWEDVIDDPNYYRQSASIFQSGNTFKFTVNTAANASFTGHGGNIWWSLSSASTAIPKPVEPVKIVDKEQASLDEEFAYTIEQKVHTAGMDIQGKYLSFTFHDVLPEEVTYVENSAKMLQVVDNGATDITSTAGSFNYSRTNHTLAYTFKASYLKSMLMNGETYRMTFRTTINSKAVAHEPFTNTVTVAINKHGQDASATTTPSFPAPEKIAYPATGSKVAAHDDIIYTLSYTNKSTVTEKVTLSDMTPLKTHYVENSLQFPKGVASPYTTDDTAKDDTTGQVITSATWNAVQPKETVAYSFTVKIDEGVDPDYIIENIGYLSINDRPQIATNPTTHVTGEWSIEALKHSQPESGSSVMTGEEITYTLIFTNTGASAARNIAIYDAIPLWTHFVHAEDVCGASHNEETKSIGWNIEQLLPGESVTLTFVVAVDKDAPAETTIANVATYAPDTPGIPITPLPAPTNETIHLTGEPAIEVTKSSNPENGSPVGAEDEITYTLTVKNVGKTKENGIAVYDTIPHHTSFFKVSTDYGGTFFDDSIAGVGWYIEELAVGELIDLQFIVKVNGDVTGGTWVNNTATFESGRDTVPDQPLSNSSNEVKHHIPETGNSYERTGGSLHNHWLGITVALLTIGSVSAIAFLAKRFRKADYQAYNRKQK